MAINNSVNTTKMNIILLLTFLTFQLAPAFSNTCRNEMFYDYQHGYGYKISCNNTNLEELSNIVVYNEILLTITDSSISLDPNIFNNLKKLRQLNITHTNIIYNNTPALSSLEHLEVLTLTHDGLTKLDRNLFSGLSKLRVLNLEINALSEFDVGSFKDLFSLRSLNLSYNHISDTRKLHICDLFNLERLILNHNIIESIEANNFACLMNLEFLHLDGNRLKILHPLNSFTLNELHLSNNFIEHITTFNSTNLVKLHLEGNKLTSIHKSYFNDLPYLTHIYLSRNQIAEITSMTFNTNTKLKFLDIDGNNISSLNINISSLERFNAENNQIAQIVGANFTNLGGVKVMNLGKNRITSIDADAFKQLHALEDLNLGDNLLAKLKLNFLKKSTLSVLNLSHNNLTFLDEGFFKHQANLKDLDLSCNELHYLNSTLFLPLDNLERLNLSYNKLKELSYELVRPLENLRIMDIEGNLLTTIDFSFIINLDAINVKNNLFSCDFLAKMIHFFKQNEVNYTINEKFQYDKENVAGIYCKETQSKLLTLEETEEVVKNNSRILSQLYDISKQRSIPTSTVILLTFVVMFVIIAALTVVYRCALWQKRKQYIIDELELISNIADPYKPYEQLRS